MTDKIGLYMDHLADAVLILGHDGVVRYANRTAETFFGRPQSELIGRSFGLPRVAGDMAAVDIPRRDGSTFYGEMRASKVDYGGEPCILASIRDISDRRQARQSEQRFWSAFLSATHGMGLAGLDGRWIEANGALCEMLGASSTDLIGADVTTSIHEDDVAGLIEQWRRVARGDVPSAQQREIRIIDKNERHRTAVASIGLVRDADDVPVYHMVQLIDVTQWRAAEEQLRQAQKMEAVGQLTGGIAHDFNNILGIIMGNLQLIQRMLDGDAKVADRVERALGASRRGADLTRRLLAFSRRQVLEPRAVDLGTLVSEVVELAERTLGTDVEVKVEAAPDTWPVEVDDSQLENAILNMCVNARDAMPDGGVLSITARNEIVEQDVRDDRLYLDTGEYAVIEISDTGTGMPEEVRRRIFEPFFTTKEKGKGTGLGMSMVYGFVKQSHGFLNVASEEGVGTTMTIHLPRAPGAVAADGGAADGGAAATAPEGSECILVVDDEEAIRDTARDMLDAHGYRVLEARDGLDALEVLRRRPEIDLMLVDVVMPGGMSGVDLIRAVRRRTPDMKVLLQSGYAAGQVDMQSFDNQTTGFIAKPYANTQLVRRIRKLLDT